MNIGNLKVSQGVPDVETVASSIVLKNLPDVSIEKKITILQLALEYLENEEAYSKIRHCPTCGKG